MKTNPNFLAGDGHAVSAVRAVHRHCPVSVNAAQ